MVDFKETAYEIFKIVTDIKISNGHAAEKIEEILKQVYESGISKGDSQGYQEGWNDGANLEY